MQYSFRIHIYYTALLFTVLLGVSIPLYAQQNNDTTTILPDSLRKYEPTKKPTFSPKDRYGDPFSNFTSPSPLLLDDPASLKLDVEIDTGMNYTIYEKIGDINYRPTSQMTFDEFTQYQTKRAIKEYWQERSAGLDGESAVSGRQLIPPIYVSPVLDRIFGGSYVDIRPSGFVTLDFGGRWQRVENPAIPIRQQRNGGFEFDMQLSTNLVGRIGEKLEITADFDNNNSFDFQNDFKVAYTGFEEDIIKLIEVGNVSLPVNNSLITGSSNLFGVKTQLQFGKLFITAVASNQRGKSETIEIEGGVQSREFEIRASEYEENRHFFLGHFFRENYQQWLTNIPQINSLVNVTRIEVYVINRNNTTDNLRNVAGFMDLGEGSVIYSDQVISATNNRNNPNNNQNNNLYSALTGNPNLRNIDNLSGILEDASGLFRFEKATDYERITGARLLREGEEYRINRQLGYLTLTRRLQNDEALAVAYEYSYNGNRFQVGELSDDYSNLPENQVVFLKLLRPTKINTQVPTWDLMMKNIYNLNASQVSREGFQLRIIYRDDQTGVDNPSLHEGVNTKDVQLVELLRLDRLNPNGDPQRDGNFDFVEGITIDPQTGSIIFPVLEPFGSYLESRFAPSEQALIDKYVYDTLYRTTKADAELFTTQNKFFIKGEFVAGSASEITLPGINIPPGSVRITAGGQQLQENVDFRVDYTFGKVEILNQGILNSGKKIQISFEKADLFNFQSRRFSGFRADYNLTDDITFGATLLRLREIPLITRVGVGNEPTQNTQWGFDLNFRRESMFLTKMVDFLPLIQTREPSLVTFNGEFAQMIPGSSNVVGDEAISYLDDFENSATPINIGNFNTWKLASTPRTNNDRFDLSNQFGTLGYNYKRAKVAWYVVDNVFYRSFGPARPENIDPDDLNNHYTRPVPPQEIFTQRDLNVINQNLPVFDIAFYPGERGPYNFNAAAITPEGKLSDPKTNWAGITRGITTDVDFDKTNIEYIEFWLMDPFIQSENGVIDDGSENPVPNSTGGKLYFNLGSISEDLMKDGRHFFENGLPAETDDQNFIPTDWGKAPANQYINNAFDNAPESRANQDVGFDGLRNEEEQEQYSDFLNSLNVAGEVREQFEQDPSGDDFRYYLGDELDAADLKILERYKEFNGTENNSPIASAPGQQFAAAGTTIPDNEDLNNDNTLSDLEEYYEYEVDLRPGQLEVGRGYIMDKVTNSVNGEPVSWYLFRVPIRQPSKTVGNISDFKSIRYIRMYMTDFEQPVVLRMMNFRLVGSQWRRYLDPLQQDGFGQLPEPYDPQFIISVVNIEENSQVQQGEDKIPYTLPPGFRRDQDNTSLLNRRLNEQSLQLCVGELRDGDSRAAYKNIVFDLINYGRVKMFLHANSTNASDDQVSAFIRFGTDFDENYYEIELPLKITPFGTTTDRGIWPEENEIDVPFSDLYDLKAERNVRDVSRLQVFSVLKGRYKYSVKGNPDLSSVQTVMIGVRNPSSPDREPKQVCVWANELRVTDFDQTKGWAANARLTTKLADLANVSATARYVSVGYGNLQQRISERSRDETLEYDVSANVNVDKFFPDWFSLKLPMFASYQTTTITPFFDPRDPDILLSSSIRVYAQNPDLGISDYRSIVTDNTIRRSLNFSNVRWESQKEDKIPFPWDISNFSFSYAYSDINRTNFETALFENRNYRGGFTYDYSPALPPLEPFKNVAALNSPWLKIIKDVNVGLLPSSLSFRTDVNRRFTLTQLRNAELSTFNIAPLFEKSFTFNRDYTMRWAVFKSLNIDYRANAQSIIDEPEGDINTLQKRDSIVANILRFGRMKQFDQTITGTYQLPFDKLPVTDWINGDIQYSAIYGWTAGALGQQDTLGNMIQNSNTQTINGKLDLVKLYNKVKILKEVNTPPRPARPSARPPSRQQEEEDTIKTIHDYKLIKSVLRTMMSVRNITVSYSQQAGTLLPGFMQQPFLFGLDSSFSNPGVGFILGSQDIATRQRLADGGYLSRDTSFALPFNQTISTDLTARASIEPFTDFKIQLDLKRSTQGRYEEIFQFNEDINGYRNINPGRTGAYNISYIFVQTAFRESRNDNSSPLFEQFEENRRVILRRLEQLGTNGPGIYVDNSQEVLIPAFIAAYTDQSAEQISLAPFPRFPLPNWRIDYAGLSKIPAMKEIFSSVTVNHAYTGSYAIANYNASTRYTEGLDLSTRFQDYMIASQLNNPAVNEFGEFAPLFVLGQVTISERFNPLVGISVRTKSRLTAKIEYRKERNLALNITNAQVTELNSNDISLDMGFTKSEFKLPFRVRGRTVTLDNDLTFRLNVTFRDTETIQRKLVVDSLNTEQNIITNGNLNFQLRPNISYVLNEKLDLTFYFENNINAPKVSSSFRRSTTAFGFQLRFRLSE